MQNGSQFTELNQKSAKYEEVYTFLKRNEHLFTWGPNEIVLDAGCGPGDVAAHVLLPWLPSNFRGLLGVDVSAGMIKHATEHYAGDKLTYTTADIGSNLPLLLNDEKWDQGFDKVFSFFVLHWLQDLRLGLKNLHHVMKPRAEGLIVFPTDHVFQKTYYKMGTTTPWRKYASDVIRNIPPFPVGPDPCVEFKDMLTSVGLKAIKCETWENYSTFSNIESFKSLIESLNQDMECIPKEFKDVYIDDCVNEMMQMDAVSQKEGQVILKQSMLLAVVVKF